MKPKAVCRKVFSCLGHDQQVIRAISKTIPDLCPDMENAYKSKELLQFKKKYPHEFAIIDRLDGVISHESQHAGGVIIQEDIASKLPIKSIADNRKKYIAGFDKYMLEEMGHFKFDILALITLPLVKYALDSIYEDTGEVIDLSSIDLEDKNIYSMLCTGDVSGVFQIANQRDAIIRQMPKNFRDLIAINALIRPGVGDFDEYVARRQGKDWKTHSDRMPYIRETEGLLCYQEQYLLDAKTFAGWGLAYADKHIRKNKRLKYDEELKDKFISDSVARGYDESEMRLLWKEIVDIVSCGYGFNKSHSASYAMLTYQTAWLKYYYPSHFYSALMTYTDTSTDGQVEIGGYIYEAKQKGIKIIPPDINKSLDTFIAKGDTISYKLTALKGVGESAIKSILKLRPILDLPDLLERRAKKDVKSNVITSLIKAGCFDFYNDDRLELMNSLQKKPLEEEWNDKLKSKWEKESLGIYLTTSPLEKYGFRPIEDFKDGQIIIQGGEVGEIKEVYDKNKKLMAFVTLQTLFGNVRLIVFSKTYAIKSIKDMLNTPDVQLLVKGKKQGREILLDSAEILN